MNNWEAATGSDEPGQIGGGRGFPTLLLVLLSGCAWSQVREPAQDVRVHYVADSQGICRKINGSWDIYFGCAWWNRVLSSCDIFVPSGAPAFVLAHERRHCAGEDHL